MSKKTSKIKKSEGTQTKNVRKKPSREELLKRPRVTKAKSCASKKPKVADSSQSVTLKPLSSRKRLKKRTLESDSCLSQPKRPKVDHTPLAASDVEEVPHPVHAPTTLSNIKYASVPHKFLEGFLLPSLKLKQEKELVSWMLCMNVLKRPRKCSIKCQNFEWILSGESLKNSRDQVHFECPNCRKKIHAIRHGSFFERLRCSIVDALYCILAWCEKKSPEATSVKTGVNIKTVKKVFGQCLLTVKRFVTETLAMRGLILGGPGSVVLLDLWPQGYIPVRRQKKASKEKYSSRTSVLWFADTKHVPVRCLPRLLPSFRPPTELLEEYILASELDDKPSLLPEPPPTRQQRHEKRAQLHILKEQQDVQGLDDKSGSAEPLNLENELLNQDRKVEELLKENQPKSMFNYGEERSLSSCENVKTSKHDNLKEVNQQNLSSVHVPEAEKENLTSGNKSCPIENIKDGLSTQPQLKNYNAKEIVLKSDDKTKGDDFLEGKQPKLLSKYEDQRSTLNFESAEVTCKSENSKETLKPNNLHGAEKEKAASEKDPYPIENTTNKDPHQADFKKYVAKDANLESGEEGEFDCRDILESWLSDATPKTFTRDEFIALSLNQKKKILDALQRKELRDAVLSIAQDHIASGSLILVNEEAMPGVCSSLLATGKYDAGTSFGKLFALSDEAHESAASILDNVWQQAFHVCDEMKTLTRNSAAFVIAEFQWRLMFGSDKSTAVFNILNHIGSHYSTQYVVPTSLSNRNQCEEL